jgi:DNA primase
VSRVAATVKDLVEQYVERARFGGEGEWVGRCPFHDDQSPSFSINENSGLWVCHAQCGGGTLPIFLYYLGFSRRKIDKVLKPIKNDLEAATRRGTKVQVHGDPYRALFPLPNSHLGIYDVDEPHPSLIKAGFDPALLEKYDIGFDPDTRRITYPIRDLYGNLAGISGRVTRTTTEHTDEKYRVFKTELRRFYPDYEIDRRRHLWNMDRVYPALYKAGENHRVTVVEGYKACLWLIQHGFRNTVALQGSSISRAQLAQLHRLGCPITLFLDNDVTGRKKTATVGNRLYGPVQDITVVDLPEKAPQQPDDFDGEELGYLHEDALPYWKWLRRR